MELGRDLYDTCLWVVGCKKPNPKINSYGIKSMKSSLEVGFMVKLQVIDLEFRTNHNKSLYLDCVWVMTHIRVV